MQHFRPYRAENGEYHRPCAKAECHRVYDETKGDFAVKRDAVIALARKLNKTELTARSWASDWKNSGYLRRAARRDDTVDQTAVVARAKEASETRQIANGVAEEPTRFRDEQVRRALHLGSQVPATVMIDPDLLAESESLGLNLSDILGAELRKRVKDERGRRWAEENREFIDSYNAYIERNGVFGEELLDLDDPPV